MPDTFFTELAVDSCPAGAPKPFFLWVGFYVTHSPFRFPVEFRGLFDPGLRRSPRSARRTTTDPEVFRDLTDSDKRGIIAAYHTSSPTWTGTWA